MDVVLRPISDRFFQEVLLPFFHRAMGDAPGALSGLALYLGDEQTRGLCEVLASQAPDGGLDGVDPERWAELVDRLVFPQWSLSRTGWRMVSQRAGYAGGWDEALHLALMVEEPQYPYWNPKEARAMRDRWRLRPVGGLGLASLVAGQWEPFPDFAPDRVLFTQGRGEYRPNEPYAFADWAWRPARIVQHWHSHLTRKLEGLLTREQQRLKLASLPERDEVLAYWTGKAAQPPPLTVAFSGLGHRSPYWVTELGVLAAHLREAAQERAALVGLVTQGFTPRE